METKCPEDDDDTVDRYSGLDLDELRKRSSAQKSNLSLTYRLAVRLKAKAYTGERINQQINEAIADLKIEYDDAVESDDTKLAAEVQKKLSGHKEQRAQISKQVDEAYRESLPLAVAVHDANSEIDSVALLLADVNFKLGNVDDSVTFLKESIVKVPFFVPLRDKLAGIYAKQKKWDDAARELAGVCRLVSCRASTWDETASNGIPSPLVGREILITEMASKKDAYRSLVSEFEKAITADSRNPNLRAFLAMIYFYGGDKKNAVATMLQAEALGVCGEGGREHELAAFIYERRRW